MIRSFLAFFLMICVVNAKISEENNMFRLRAGLTYLKKQPILDVNATLNLVIADAELLYLTQTASSIRDDQASKIKYTRLQLKNLIDKVKEDQPNDYAVENLFDSEYWVLDGDYRFIAGRVSGPESTKSLEEIYGRSIITDESCNNELYSNMKTDKARSCGISQDCMDKMTDTTDEGSIAPMQRLIFLSSLRYLKCTENPENSFNIVTDLCNLIYKQVLKLATDYKSEKAYFYMDKVLLCGTYGFPEFYHDNIVKILIKQQSPNGSFGKGTGLETQVLTAQFMGILSSMYRLKLTTP